MIVASREGRAFLAKAWKGDTPGGGAGFTVHLFTNDFTPTPSSNNGDFTEATFDGYAGVGRTYSTTTGPTLDGDDQQVRMGGDYFAFNCTGSPQTVYGWYLTDDTSSAWLLADKYDVPHVLEVGSAHHVFIDPKVGQCG